MSTPVEMEDVTLDLFLNGKFSDMEIICQGVPFKVHRAIVCTQSSFFERVLSSGFRESIEQKITLSEDTPETIERVLSFLYLREYRADGHILPIPTNADLERTTTNLKDQEKQNAQQDDSETLKTIALNHVQVFVAADKYGIKALKTFADKAFCNWVTTNWNSSIFHEVVEYTITSVPPHELGLLRAIAKTFSDHMDLAQNKAMLKVLALSGDLGALVAENMLRKTQRLKHIEKLNAKLQEQLEHDKTNHELVNSELRTQAEEQLFLNRQLQNRLNTEPPLALWMLVLNLGSRNKCRHCTKIFNVKLLADEAREGIFRCASCNTRNP